MSRAPKRKGDADRDDKSEGPNKRGPAAAAASGEGFVVEHRVERDVLPQQQECISYDQLSPDQKEVVEAIKAGRNVFFTGPAGTGKSFLLEYLRSVVYAGDDTTHFTAMTGLAAVHIGGRTLHSWAKIGLGQEDTSKYIESIKSNRAQARHWRSARRLFVDEVSMLDTRLLEKLDRIARGVRGDYKVFGGIQLILSGDFLQLPPVAPGRAEPSFAFESVTWTSLDLKMFSLRTVFRQKNVAFVKLLNELRFGLISPESEAILEECSNRVLPVLNGIVPTKLMPTRREVAEMNAEALAKINSPARRYEATDSCDDEKYRHLLDHCQADKVIELKVGAQVILLKNYPDKDGDITRDLCNGSRGIVVGFTDIRSEEHKEYGSESIPIVRFENKVMRVIERAVFEMGSSHYSQKARRAQVPLLLAWALTIHKSQGQTLDRVQLNVAKTFEGGQLYVGVSRVRNLKGLSLIGFSKGLIKANRKAVDWYRRHFPDSVPVFEQPVAPTVAAAAAGAGAGARPAAAAAAAYADPELDALLASEFDALTDSAAPAAAAASSSAVPVAAAASHSLQFAKK
jgi:ATP-dependent DNA helicase PIF1